MEELQEALKQNGGQIAGVLEGIQERIQAYDRGELGLEDEREENGAYKDGLKCKPKEDDKGFVEFKVNDLALLKDYVRKARGEKTVDKQDATTETEPVQDEEDVGIPMAFTQEGPPTIDAEFEVVEPKDTGEHGVVLANPDVVDAEFDDRDALVRQAIELAGGGGDEPPRNADRDFDVDEEEMQPVNDARYGHGGAGVAAGVVGVGAAAAAAGGGGGGGQGEGNTGAGMPGARGRGGARRGHGTDRDLAWDHVL